MLINVFCFFLVLKCSHMILSKNGQGVETPAIKFKEIFNPSINFDPFYEQVGWTSLNSIYRNTKKSINKNNTYFKCSHFNSKDTTHKEKIGKKIHHKTNQESFNFTEAENSERISKIHNSSINDGNYIHEYDLVHKNCAKIKEIIGLIDARLLFLKSTNGRQIEISSLLEEEIKFKDQIISLENKLTNCQEYFLKSKLKLVEFDEGIKQLE